MKHGEKDEEYFQEGKVSQVANTRQMVRVS